MKIPFTPEGDQFPVVPNKEIFMRYSLQPRDNLNFKEELRFDYFVLIENIVMALFRDSNNNRHYMHLDEFERIIKIDRIRKGKVKGIFRYTKDKQTYSIYLRDDIVEDEDIE